MLHSEEVVLGSRSDDSLRNSSQRASRSALVEVIRRDDVLQGLSRATRTAGVREPGVVHVKLAKGDQSCRRHAPFQQTFPTSRITSRFMGQNCTMWMKDQGTPSCFFMGILPPPICG